MAKILIVDDDSQILTVFSDFIRKMGHDTATAANGREALQYLDEHQVDLMLLDIIMPEQDGIGTILELKRMAKRPAIIAISGGSRTLEPDFIQSVVGALKIDNFLQKPVNFNDLKTAIEKALLSSY
jgi:CheY-like chemotaxis protein